ncbi:hypothetical protein [Sulfobacillus harzensis]|uniref:Uncharacterized protein n=1 Tax=Sulfobacillus harzensis TaxID=2729629 RepID=A0A7Y0Q3H3_9FIRM|nr:hypothetical protein [Sulfobacillus harzensis]NMP22189.1 hypothetical protein [Sulfobacillus harzensis]
MTLHPDGTVEGTPDELAAYQTARERMQCLPLPNPGDSAGPWKTKPAKPWIGDDPDPAPYWVTQRGALPKKLFLCDTCRAKLARGEQALCGCVILERDGVRM